jgi:hypothetical protein
MAAETGMTDNPYGIQGMWEQSDYVGKGVFVILIVMSLVVVMINKWPTSARSKGRNEAEKNFWSGSMVRHRSQGQVNPFRDIAQDGLQAADHHRKSARAMSRAGSTYRESHIEGALTCRSRPAERHGRAARSARLRRSSGCSARSGASITRWLPSRSPARRLSTRWRARSARR